MSDKTELSGRDAIGCTLALWSLLVTCPMWLVLLFAVLQATDQPSWAWVLYWCYVPAHILGIGAAGMMKFITR